MKKIRPILYTSRDKIYYEHPEIHETFWVLKLSLLTPTTILQIILSDPSHPLSYQAIPRFGEVASSQPYFT